MNKKGQGLPMNTVVMAILVIVVLILVLTFFFGGFTGLSNKIRLIFFGSLEGTSITLAEQNCDQYCTQLQLRANPNIETSAFCKLRPVDEDEDGQADVSKNCEGFGVSCVLDGSQVDCPGDSEKPIE